MGQLLAQLRKSQQPKVSQAEIARRMGLFTRYIQKIEAGEIAMTVAWMHRYMTALGLHFYLLTLPEDGHCPRADEAQQALSALHEARKKPRQN